MNITDVRVRKITDEGKMKCIVSITFDNLFVVHDIKVIEEPECEIEEYEVTEYEDMHEEVENLEEEDGE